MLRSITRTHARPSLRPSHLSLGPKSRYFTDGAVQASTHFHLVDSLLLKTHELTALPWVVSIPLTLILARSFFIPWRLRQARREKEQYHLTPQLKVLREIVEKQNDMKIAAKELTPKEGLEWKRQEFEKRKSELEKEHPCIKLSLWDIGEATGTRLSIASIGSAFIFVEIISSFDRLDLINPSLTNLGLIDANLVLVPVTFCAAMAVLSTSNMIYYLRAQPTRTEGWITSDNILIAPASLAILLCTSPPVVIFTAFCHSAYTYVERKTIARMLDMPKSERFVRQRSAVQHNVGKLPFK